MSCDIYPHALEWEPFVAANETASDTLALFMELANSDKAAVPLDSFEGRFCLAEDAAECYEDVRGALPDDQRESWDQILYAGWWMPPDEVLEETPSLKNITTEAIPFKGKAMHGLVRALSPATVAHVARAWQGTDRNVLVDAMNSTFEDGLWLDSFESVEAVCEYLSTWGEVFSLAAIDGLGIVVLLSC